MINNLEKRFDSFVALVKSKYKGYLIFGGYFLDKFVALVKQYLPLLRDELTELLKPNGDYDAAVDRLIDLAKTYIKVPFPVSLVLGMALNALGRWLKDHREELISDLIAMEGPTF
jgi:hypothetical protein